MATHTINIALLGYAGPYYLYNTTSVTVGDTVTISVFYGTGDIYTATCNLLAGSPYNMGQNAINIPSGSHPVTGAADPAVFTFQVLGAGGTEQNFDFYGSYDGVMTAYPDSARVKLLVTDPAACNIAGPSGTLSVSVAATEHNSTTATLSGLTAGTNCALQYRSVLGSTVSSWQTSNVFGVNRGNTYTFQARHATYSGGTPTVVSSASTYVPYLDPDLSISIGSASITTSDGTWTQTVSGITGTYNNYSVYKYYLNNWIAIHGIYDLRVATGIGGTSINNNQPTNTPEDQTTTYRIYGNRTWVSGGSGIWQYTGTTFNVTRGTTHAESIVDPTGTYFDNYSGTGSQHIVNVAGTTAGWYYNVVTGDGTAGWSSWETGNGARIVTDPDTTVPSGTGATTYNYTLWRSENSDGSSPESTSVVYARTLANYARFTLEDVSLGGTDTTFTQTIGNTIAGHTYYIFRGQNLLASVVASGTSTDISVTDTSIPDAGDTATHTLKTQSPANSSPASEYDTGITCTITRTGSGEEQAGTTPGTFGMEVYASDGVSKLYDTTSRTGRIMASGRAPPTGDIAHNATVTTTVTGLQNTTDYNIVALPEVGGAGDSLGSYAGYIFEVTKSSGSFTIKNESGLDNAYHYYVLKSGGS